MTAGAAQVVADFIVYVRKMMEDETRGFRQ
jgi:hypothetical protein